jgi:hypothetical protein
MNPLRPRVLAAGSLFVIFLALPYALVLELLRQDLWKSDEKWWFKSVNLLYVYYLSCNLVLLAAGFIFDFDQNGTEQPTSMKTWQIATIIVLIVLVIIILVAIQKKIPKWLKAIGMAALLIYLTWQAYDALFLRHLFLRNAPFLWMIGIGCIVLHEMQIRSWKLKLGSWPNTLIVFMAILTVFSTIYYPHIKSSWGGGTPVPVTIILSKDAVGFASQQLNCSLVEDTDSGFYLIGSGDKHATFISRSSVSSIHFAGGSEPSSLIRPTK